MRHGRGSSSTGYPTGSTLHIGAGDRILGSRYARLHFPEAVEEHVRIRPVIFVAIMVLPPARLRSQGTSGAAVEGTVVRSETV